MFVLSGFDSLFDILKAGLMGYSTDYKQPGGTTTVHLFLTTGEIVKIYSEMHDIDSWNEIGSLVFEMVQDCPHSKIIPLEPGWKSLASVKKLVLDREEFIAESGIILRSDSDETFLIVTSANVYTLAVKAPFARDEFFPENDLSAYHYIPLR